ncbi:MAG: class I SAM-dependent methyltransferase [Hyphomicrobiaceae bacterium]
MTRDTKELLLGSPPPLPWVTRHLPGVPAGGTVLDLACGSGRHTRAALAAGHPVVAVDRDTSGVADLAGRPDTRIVQCDLESGAPFPIRGSFAGVIVTNYLWRPILPDIVAAVAGDGLLIYQTFAAGNERFGRPSNPAFLLRPGELLEAVAGRLVVVAYEYVTEREPDRVVQRIVAAGSRHRDLEEHSATSSHAGKPS